MVDNRRYRRISLPRAAMLTIRVPIALPGRGDSAFPRRAAGSTWPPTPTAFNVYPASMKTTTAG